MDIDGVTGPVLRPGDPGFDDEQAGFQTGFRHRPDLVVGAAGAADVQAAVRYAAERGLRVAVQATGHGLTDPLDGGVLITTSRMTGVRVDPVARTARVEAGVRWGQVVRAAAEHGLAPPSGSGPGVGAVGYTLGGGIGLLARRFGYASDHVRGFEVVNADGERRTVGPDDELFRGLRGAAPGTGAVVTAMEIGLLPVAQIYGGGLYFDLAQVPDLLAAYRDWTATLPEELTSSVGLIPYPDLPGLPEPLRGRHVAHVRIVHLGNAASGERLVAPLREAGPRLIESLAAMPFADAAATVYREPDEPHSYLGTNALLSSLDGDAPARIAELAADPSVLTIVQLRHLGGALARLPAVPDAVAHRDAGHLLQVLSPLDPHPAAQVRPVHQGLLDAVAPWTVGRAPNFVFGPEREVAATGTA